MTDPKVTTLVVNPFVGQGKVTVQLENSERSVDLAGRSPREMAETVIHYAGNVEATRVAVHTHGLGQLVYDELRLSKPEGVTVVRR